VLRKKKRKEELLDGFGIKYRNTHITLVKVLLAFTSLSSGEETSLRDGSDAVNGKESTNPREEAVQVPLQLGSKKAIP
jgi:hypothetical protein